MSVGKFQSSRSFQNLLDPNFISGHKGGSHNLSLSSVKGKEFSHIGPHSTNRYISGSPERQRGGNSRFQLSDERASSDTSRYMRVAPEPSGRSNLGNRDRSEDKLPSLRVRPFDDPEAVEALINLKKPHRRARKSYGNDQRSYPSRHNNPQEHFFFQQPPNHLQQHHYIQQQQQYQESIFRSQQQSVMNQIILKAIERIRTNPKEHSDDEDDNFMENHRMIRALDKQSGVLQRIALDLRAESNNRSNQESLSLMHKIDKAELKNHMYKGQNMITKFSTMDPSEPFDPEASEGSSADEENEKERLQQVYNQLKLERSKAAENKLDLQIERPKSLITLKTPLKADRKRTESDRRETLQSENFQKSSNQPHYFLQPQMNWYQMPMPQQSFQMGGGGYGFSQPNIPFQQAPYQPPFLNQDFAANNLQQYPSSSLQPQFNRLPFGYQNTQYLPGLPELRFPDWNGTHQFPSLEQQYLFNPGVKTVYREGSKEEKKAQEESKSPEGKEPPKKRKKFGKSVLKKKLKTYLWLICYSNLLRREAERKVGARKQKIQLSNNSRQQSAFASAQAFILKNCAKELDEIYKEKKTMVIVSGDEKGLFGSKALSEKDADSRIKELIIPKLNALVTSLITATNAGNFPIDLALFLASISEDQCVPPNNFYLSLELDRLSFSHLGTLKNMADAHSKMVIACFIVARVLVYQFLLDPWSQIPSLKSVPKNDMIKKGLKTLGSILTILIEDRIRSSVKIENGNQNNLSPEGKIKPYAYGAILYSDKENEKITPKNMIKERAIAGIYTKEDLMLLFRNKKQEADQLNSLVGSWIDEIYKLTHQEYQEKRQIIMSSGNS